MISVGCRQGNPVQHAWIHQNIHHWCRSKSWSYPKELTFWIVGRRGVLGGTRMVAGKSTGSIGCSQTSLEALQYLNKPRWISVQVMDILSSSPLYSQGTRLGEVWGLATCRREVLLNSDIHLAKSRAHPFYHEVPSFLILAVFSFPKGPWRRLQAATSSLKDGSLSRRQRRVN